MKVIRIFLAIIFAFAIILWIWKYYTAHSEVQISNPFAHWFANDQKSMMDTENNTVNVSSDLVHIIKNMPTDWKSHTKDMNFLDAEFSKGVLSLEEQNRLLKRGVMWWNNDGDIVWLHYCDFDVEYCQKSYEEWITYDYQEMIPNLTYIYKPFPPTMQPLDVLPHHAVLCASDLGDKKQAIAYYNMLYKKPEMRNSLDALVQGAKELGIDGMQECLAQDNYNLLIQQEIKFVKRLFGIRALPANIFLNKKTKQWILVPGYYEKEEVQGAIEWILEN